MSEIKLTLNIPEAAKLMSACNSEIANLELFSKYTEDEKLISGVITDIDTLLNIKKKIRAAVVGGFEK